MYDLYDLMVYWARAGPQEVERHTSDQVVTPRILQYDKFLSWQADLRWKTRINMSKVAHKHLSVPCGWPPLVERGRASGGGRPATLPSLQGYQEWSRSRPQGLTAGAAPPLPAHAPLPHHCPADSIDPFALDHKATGGTPRNVSEVWHLC